MSFAHNSKINAPLAVHRTKFDINFLPDVKLILCDVDGTLINSDGKIGKRTKNAIKLAISHGVKFSICSGRSSSSMFNYLDELGISNGYNSFLNGGCIMKDGRLDKIEKMTKSEALTIADYIKKFGAGDYIRIYDSDVTSMIEKVTENSKIYDSKTGIMPSVVSSFSDALPNEVCKVLILAEEELCQHVSKNIAVHLPHNVNMFFSAKYLLEFTPAKATKGSALNYISEKLNIDKANIMAIGDNFNDISMLSEAGIPICPANAAEEVRLHSIYTTYSSNEQDAVGEAIEKFVLNRYNSTHGE